MNLRSQKGSAISQASSFWWMCRKERKRSEENIALCIKLIEGGAASSYLKEKVEGDILTYKGPLGNFNPLDGGRQILIGVGTGIAPLRGIIRHLLKKGIKDK